MVKTEPFLLLYEALIELPWFWSPQSKLHGLLFR